MSKTLYKLPVRGGILSPGELLRVISLARALGQDGFHFGSRQDIIFRCPPPPPDVLARFPDLPLQPLDTSRHSNIVCSYVAADIFPRTSWLTSASYLYLLEQMNFAPRLEINITDPRQRLTPLFTGHLNFIASEREDFWYLYAKLPGWAEMEQFPALLHSWDLAGVAEALNAAAEELTDLPALVRVANRNSDLNLRDVERDLVIPFRPFPFYEGMNRVDGSTFWLGLYWRNNWYDLDFLEATCHLCREHRIGKVCITSWKSFVINGIPAERRIEWERLLGRFGINARHSSLELNWHLPVADAEALELKRYLVRAFDQRDISTYGLTFAISTDYGTPFTSVVIDSERPAGVIDGYAVRPTYNLRYARNFDPNTREYVEYARQVDRSELVDLMVELSRRYFERLDERAPEIVEARRREPAAAAPRALPQCGNCRSVYDPALGDPEQDVPPGTPFAELGPDYHCWTCGAPRAAFAAAELVLD